MATDPEAEKTNLAMFDEETLSPRAAATRRNQLESLITEEWLASVGFKWHEMERQTCKHWLLWLGEALVSHDGVQGRGSCHSDLGIELTQVAPNRPGAESVVYRGSTTPEWFCWLRSDSAYRYHRFIHVRHLTHQHEVEALVAALTGQKWNPVNHLYGTVRTPEWAAALRAESERLDQALARDNPAWYDTEKDDTRGGPLLDHLHAHEKRKADQARAPP